MAVRVRVGVGGVSAGPCHHQNDGDFGRSRGRERLRFGEGIWGREKLRWGVGVDAEAGVDKTLQRARRGAEFAGRIGSESRR